MKERTKAPYVTRIEQRGELNIWVVDGSYVRGHIDEEFTNFGQHYRYSYIPKNEFWLDQEAEHDERRFFIEHLLVEHRLMEQGKSYAEAFVEADKHERTERRRAGDMRKVTSNGNSLPNGAEMHEKIWKALESGITVWIVNGRLVRSTFDIDYTEGGHDKVYKFVPTNEVWIDDAIVEQERGYVLLHELHERNQMSKGMPYNQAHAESSKIEFRCRHHPDELHDALAAEGWT